MNERFEVIPTSGPYPGMTKYYVNGRVIQSLGVGEAVEKMLREHCGKKEEVR